MEFMRSIGALALASRLRSLSETLMRDVTKIYRELDLDFEARWFTIFYLLKDHGPLPVTGVAAAVNQTHPSVSQVARALEKRGLVERARIGRDDRKRFLRLTERGRVAAKKLEPVWRDIEAAVEDIIVEGRRPLLAAVDSIEDAYGKQSLYDRVMERIRKRRYDSVEIVEFRPGFAAKFRDLNYEWLKKYFKIEKTDRLLLCNPKREIIDKGGFIYFARLDGEIIGTCALLRLDRRTYEISKMAVTEKAQGLHAGEKLMDACLGKARKLNLERLVIETNRRLVKAVNLYRKKGFVEVPSDPALSHQYERTTFMLELRLR